MNNIKQIAGRSFTKPNSFWLCMDVSERFLSPNWFIKK